MTNAYRRQHLVSRILQARFTTTTGPHANHVEVLNRATPDRPRFVGPRGSAKEDWFIDVDASRFEKTWGATENAIGVAFSELDAHTGTGPISADSAARITEFMALHLVRSYASKPLWERGLTRVVPKRREAMLNNRKLLELARSSGQYTDEQSDEEIVDAITSAFEDPLRAGGEAFGETLVELYRSLTSHFAAMHVAIGEPSSGEFLLPDLPCVAANAETDETGLLAGFGLLQADAIVMPLGPKHIASLTTRLPESGWWLMDTEELDSTNMLFAGASLESVIFRPGSGLESLVRAAWAAG